MPITEEDKPFWDKVNITVFGKEIEVVPVKWESSIQQKSVQKEIINWISVQMGPPHDSARWVKIIVHVKFNETGEVRTIEEEGVYDDDEECASLYIWEEGNYSCDCNRELFFYRAIGQEPEHDTECGGGKYSINIQNPFNGEFVYKEF